jgi:23S rRNA pseudouridine2457 synthase
MPKHRHFLLHKPVGFLSQFIRVGKRKKRLLGELYDFPEKTMAIGRLDENSEGLIFLTTDGMTSFNVLTRKFEKEYFVQVDGIITPEAIEKMRTGVEIGVKGTKYITLPCEARMLNPAPDFPLRTKKIRDERHGPTSWASITIREGKNRQIRKMTAAVGFPTLRLIRVRIGEIELGDLQLGEVVEVDELIREV